MLDFEALKPAIKELAKKHNLSLVVLFGSQATGRTHAKSDIDIAVLAADAFVTSKLMGEFDAIFKRDDIEVVDMSDASPTMGYVLTRDGMLLYEESTGAFMKWKFRAIRTLNIIPASEAPHSAGHLISRIFVDASGRSFRLTFFVVSIDGQLKARLVSAQAISEHDHSIAGETAATFYLPVICPTPVAETPYISAYAPLISPYFSLDFLINSQPTRAPSRK